MYCCLACVGVTGDVCESLLGDSKTGNLEFSWQARGIDITYEFSPYARSLRKLIDVPSQGRGKSEIIQQRGTQIERKFADLAYGLVNNRHTLFNARQTFIRLARTLNRMQIDLKGREHLANLIVQLARDPLPLGFLRFD